MLSQSDQDIRSNIVRVVDSEDRFYGTGFFIEVNQKNYCITCHHCVSNLNEIFLKRDGDIRYNGEWIEEISDPSKDIAVLRLKYDNHIQYDRKDHELDNDNKKNTNDAIKPLNYSVEVMSDLYASVFSYALKDAEKGSRYTTPGAVEVEYAKLSGSAIFVSWPDEKNRYQDKEAPEQEVSENNKNLGRSQIDSRSTSNIYGNNNLAPKYSRAPITFGLYHQNQELEVNNHHVIELSKKIWNKSPQVQLFAFKFLGRLKQSVDFSGAPVCSTHNNNVVGIMTSKDRNEAYVIPIHTILSKLIAHESSGQKSETQRERNIAGPSEPPADFLLHLRKGNDAYIKGDYGEAIKKYDVVLNDRNYIAALQNKGECLRITGYHKQSVEYFDKVLVIDPTHVVAISLKGLTLFELRKYRDAIKCSDRISLLDPNYINAITTKAASFFGLGDYKQSIEYFDKALAVNPSNFDALNGKGVVLLKLARYEQAIEYFDKALAIKPNEANILNAKSQAMDKINK
jgi:tetratricopeptide (TPR) repeat protein